MKKGFYTNWVPKKQEAFDMKRLRTLKSFQIFKIKIINQKPIAIDVLQI